MIGASDRTKPERKAQFGSGQKPDPAHTSWDGSATAELSEFLRRRVLVLRHAEPGAWGGKACVCVQGPSVADTHAERFRSEGLR